MAVILIGVSKAVGVGGGNVRDTPGEGGTGVVAIEHIM